MNDQLMNFQRPRKKRKSYKIVVFAGGGVFGYIPARFLAQTGMNKSLAEICYALGGTSIGGVNALISGRGATPEELHASFLGMTANIFDTPWYSRLWPRGPVHSDKALNTALRKALPGENFYANMLVPVIVPTINFELNRPKVYDNITIDEDLHVPAWEIARSTAAAPTYFAPWKSFIDGGLLSNLPVLETCCALKDKLGIPLDRMDVLALGTGDYKTVPRDMDKVRRWTALHWLSPMIKYLTKANEMRTDFIAKQLGLRSYTYFNPVRLDSCWDIDDPDLIDAMAEKVDRHQDDFNKVFRGFRKR